jgi:hypothetical protein
LLGRTASLALIALFAAGSAEAGVNHRKHGKEACASCHGDAEAADKTRPGSSDHRSCDGAECHAAEFYGDKAAATKVCFVCHTSKDFWTDMRELVGFPAGEGRDYYAEISHKMHLGRGEGGQSRVEKVTDQSCLFCHAIDVTTKEVARPGHAACESCHRESSKVPMSSCDACHRFRVDADGKPVPSAPISKPAPTRVTRKFSHEKHRLDRRKKEATPVSCGACHLTVAKATSIGSIEVQGGSNMMSAACGACHRSGQKTADGRPIFSITGRCTSCHDSLGDTNPVPRSHG